VAAAMVLTNAGRKWVWTLIRWQPGFPSTFPPPDAGPRRIGRNRQGRPVTVAAVGRPCVHVTGDYRGHVGMRRDQWGDGGATCKIAGIAYTGSNPVPATHLACVNTVV
jgi:hypothetical protein